MGVFSGGSQRCRLPAFHPHPSPLPQERGRIKRPCRIGRHGCYDTEAVEIFNKTVGPVAGVRVNPDGSTSLTDN